MSDSSENDPELRNTSESENISDSIISDIDSDDEIDNVANNVTHNILNNDNILSSSDDNSLSQTNTSVSSNLSSDSLVNMISVESNNIIISNNSDNEIDNISESVSENNFDLDNVSENAIDTTSGDNISGDNISGDNISGDNVSLDNVSGDNVSGDNVSLDNTPVDNPMINIEINEVSINNEDEEKTTDYKVEFALNKNTITDSSHFNNLDNTDKDFLNCIVNRSLDPLGEVNKSFITDLYNIIFSSVPLKNYVQSLVNLYDLLKNDHVYVSTKYHIATKIASLFKTIPIQRYFDKDFLTDELIDYFIKKHLFYDNMLSTLLIRDWGIQHFKFKPNKKHLTFYKVCSQKLYTRLNLFLQNSNYYSFRHSDFITYINFIKLMVRFTTDLSVDEGLSLFNSMAKLLFTILGQLYTIISTSRNTLETLDIVSEDYLKKYINRTSSDNKSRLLLEIRKCNDTINNLFLVNNIHFTTLFCSYLSDFDFICHTTHPNYSEIISVIPYLTNKWYKYKSNSPYIDNLIDNLVKDIYINKLNDIFCSKKVNVHTKVRILSDSSWKIFSNESVISSLVEYYSEIEKYDENSGFYEKELVRFHIARCILEYVKPTESIRFDPTFLYYKYQKDFIELDNYAEKMNVFDKLDSHKLCSFVTLLISEITENFVILETSNKALLDNDRKPTTHIYKVVNSFDNIIMIYELVSLLIRRKTIHNPFIINKFCELFSTVFNSSYKNRLYCHFKQFSESSLNELNIFSYYFTENIHAFYTKFFNDIRTITYNTNFTESFVDNDSLYDRKCIENTEKLIGFINHNPTDLKVTDILNRFMDVLDKKIYAKNQTLEKYDEDIPVDFVDPIYYIPIEDPIEMPNTKTIVEKKIIMNHLVFNQTNPFDGLPLTRDEIIEYNNTEEVKERIQLFLNKFNQWKQEHKIE